MACSLSETHDESVDMSHYSEPTMNLLTQSYLHQKRTCWPENGNHILAQFDEKYVVVYQAYNEDIASYAVSNQRFGGPAFSFERMSWIKTNFLWMMYRCGWASKKNQQRVLAIWIERPAFDCILSKAYSVKFQKSRNVSTANVEVRLQWDPDHTPEYTKCARRAIQLGLKGQILKDYGTRWIHRIEDITPFVLKQKKILDSLGDKQLLVSSERVYVPSQTSICARIALDCNVEDSILVNKDNKDSVQTTDEPDCETITEK